MIFRAVVCLWLSLLALSSVLIAPASLAAPQDATSEERPQLQVIIEGLDDQLLTNAKPISLFMHSINKLSLGV